MSKNVYRDNVAAIIINSTKEILLCTRRDNSGQQLPQGGIDEGEDPQTAFFREVEEETGLQNLKILGRTKEWISYDWPPEAKKKRGYLGQRQIYFIALVDDEEVQKLTPSNEFISFEWTSWEEVIATAVDFKKEAYNRAWSELEGFYNQ